MLSGFLFIGKLHFIKTRVYNLRNRGITLPKRIPSKVILGESAVF